jgi:acyl carrier protein
LAAAGQRIDPEAPFVDRPEILAGIQDIIATALEQPDLQVTMRTKAEDVVGWDSFNHVNIIVAIEDRFNLEFKSGEVEKMRAVGDLVQLIEQKLAKAAKSR